jgi:uncharacterized protein YeaO (DUF488 family)
VETPRIRTKRVYEPASTEDGARFLVERLWPRGIRKELLRLDAWMRELAPSTELRRWFGHDAEKWHGFQRRYRAELDARPYAWQPLVDAARRGPVTLLYSAHDVAHNNAVALKDYLAQKLTLASRKM